MKILVDKNNVIIVINDIIDITDEGFKVGSEIYINELQLTLFEVQNIPIEVMPQKHCYSVENGFYINGNYNEPIDIEKTIKQLQLSLTETQNALNILLGV